MDHGKMKKGGGMKESSSPAAANASGVPDALGFGFSLKPAGKKHFLRKKPKMVFSVRCNAIRRLGKAPRSKTLSRFRGGALPPCRQVLERSIRD